MRQFTQRCRNSEDGRTAVPAVQLIVMTALCLLAPAEYANTTLRAQDTKTNIVLIVLDDFGWADSGCYGSKFYRTPHIDRLASEGMRFTDFYAACPVCSPTRAALLTGKYPARLHLTDWLPGRRDMSSQRLLRPALRQQLPLEETTLAEALQAAGYACGHIGKWHLGGEGFGPTQQGFDSNIAGTASGSPPGYFAPFIRQGQVPPGLENSASGECLTDLLAAEAEKFIDKHRDRPFFLYLPHFAVHIPIQAKPDLVAKYPHTEPTSARQNNAHYAALVESVDEAIGRVLKKLDDAGLTARTLVLFTSDNGGLATREGPHTPATSNAPLREGKGYLYEGGIRVPFLARWPAGVKPGSTNSTPTCSIDLFPTVLEICGVRNTAPVDGVSLVPLLKQSGNLERTALYWHYPHYSNQGGQPGGAIREGDFKLIEFYETGRRELFNVHSNPGESTNLTDKFPEKAAELAARLDDWRKSVNAQSMSPNPEFIPNPQAADGKITLPGKTAEVHGVMLRFEPLPHKNTLGFWVRADDWASWEFQVTRPGTFRVTIVQGCGNGSGGSEVEFSVGEQKLLVTVQETGGFQNFVSRDIGTLKLDQPGRHTLSVKALKKPGVAVMDLQQVMLTPVP